MTQPSSFNQLRNVWISDETLSRWFDIASKALIILREIQSKSSPNLMIIDQFTVVCLVAWPLNESEAGGDLALIETSLFFLY